MTALVCFHDEFDHGAFLDGTYDSDPSSADAISVLVANDEDEVFGLWKSGGIERFPVPGEAPRADRLYHVDVRAQEMWTIHPESGAALSSETWEFDTVES